MQHGRVEGFQVVKLLLARQDDPIVTGRVEGCISRLLEDRADPRPVSYTHLDVYKRQTEYYTNEEE